MDDTIDVIVCDKISGLSIYGSMGFLSAVGIEQHRLSHGVYTCTHYHILLFHTLRI